VQRMFNHPLMLLLMFALCVGLIAWGLTRKKPTAEELFTAAAPLMQSGKPADWRRAWVEYLEPLSQRFPDNSHRDEIATFQLKMQDVERLDRALKQADTERPQSEAERFYRQGLAHLQNGDVAAAKRTWQAVVRSFAGVATERRWVELAERGLGRLDESRGDGRFATAREALAQARTLRDAGKRDEASRIWSGLEALYRDDPAAASVMDELRKDRGE
jgi:hypothetical protein